MKISKLISLSFFILIISGGLVFSQTLKITNATVLDSFGSVRVNWEYSGTDDLEIYRDSAAINTLALLTTITNNSQKSFIDYSAQAHLRPRSYKIQSKTDPLNVFSEKVSTIYLTIKYDSCLKQIQLKWDDLENDYFTANDWTAVQYTIRKTENSSLQTVNVPASQLEYTFDNILENTNYHFIVETSWQNQDSTGLSNPIDKYTLMPFSPSYINTLSASANGINTDLKFDMSTDSELDVYKLYKSDSYNGPFSEIETITTNDFEISTVDYNSKPDSKISYYKLVSVNGCGNETSQSDIINNIVLQVENNELINTLNWNSFKENSFNSANYEIYRITGNGAPELIRSFSNFNTITDNIESLQGSGLSGQFCYYLKASEDGSTEFSRSNTACIYLKPKVFFPNAFTPNDDGTNDKFKPVFTFLPIDYLLKIYNRWGNIVFESNDPETGWDGKQSNGKSSPTGTYIYYVKIKAPDGQSIEERGNITLFYP